MSNYDDIFEVQPEDIEEQKPFDKEEWATRKKQERDDAFALIDDTAERMRTDPEMFRTYLDVQARFDRYSVGNAILIAAQNPNATQLSDIKALNGSGVFVKKGESGIVLLEPGEEYSREDGSVGVSYKTKKVFDISQTTGMTKTVPKVSRDGRMLLKALIHDAPCSITISDDLDESSFAVYDPEQKTVFVRKGMDAPDIFRGLAQELAHAHLDKGEYDRDENAFAAYCVSYILCERNGIPTDSFDFDRVSESCSDMDAKTMRAELSKIRDTANEISSDMSAVLEQRRHRPKERTDEAR